MVNESLSPEEFKDEGNLYFCNKCEVKVPAAVKTLKIQKAPEYLLVSINRFYFDRVLSCKGKLM